MAEIFVCPKGSISDRSVRALRDAGVVVVQADDPALCRFMRPGAELDAQDMLWGALKALQASNYTGGQEQRQEFTRIMFALANERREKAKSVAAVDPADGVTTT